MTYGDSDSLFSPWYCTGDTEINMAARGTAGKAMSTQKKAAKEKLTELLDKNAEDIKKAKTSDQVETLIKKGKELAEELASYMPKKKKKD